MNKILTGLAAAGLAVSAWAQQTIPVFVTKTATGTTLAQVYFPSQPLQQARVVGAVVTSDKAGSLLTFSTGLTPATCSISNVAGTTVTLVSTNGFTNSALIVIEGANGVTNATISSISNTNLTLSAAIAFATRPGDQVYLMDTWNAITLPVGAATQNYQGEAVFVGNKGRPVRVSMDATSAGTLNSITARYE